MKKMHAYNVQIWSGLEERNTGIVHTLDEVYNICSKYVNEINECVSITSTKFVYVNGREDGVVIGFITYPWFPNTKRDIRNRALSLAYILMIDLKQYKVTVTTPHKSYMLENDPR